MHVSCHHFRATNAIDSKGRGISDHELRLAFLPFNPTLSFRSTRNHHGNCGPIIAIARFYRIRQLDVFVFSTFTRTSSRQGDAWMKGITLSVATLIIRSIVPGTSAETATQFLSTCISAATPTLCDIEYEYYKIKSGTIEFLNKCR